MAGEIGGGNGVLPIARAAAMHLPLVDADGMGRAFPEVPQVTMQLAGIPPSPAVITDERGNLYPCSARSRASGWSALSGRPPTSSAAPHPPPSPPLTAAEARGATVRNSVSLAIRIGEAITRAACDPVAALIAEIGAFRLVSGKISDVERQTRGGWVRGSVVVDGLGADAGRLIRLELQNENRVHRQARPDTRLRA